MDPLRFGLSVIPEGDPEAVIDLCVLAERLAFDYIWMADEGPEFYDPFVLLSQVAARTERIRLGTGLTNPYMRHPALIASAMISLNNISRGRAVLGIGAGGSLALPKLGLKMWEKPVSTMKSSIRALRRIFDGKEVNASSAAWKISGLKWPYSPAKIPIYVGAKGPRMIRAGTQMADGLLLSTLPVNQLNRILKLVKTRVDKSFDLAYISRVCIASEKTARKLVKPYLTFSVADCSQELLAEARISEEDQRRVRRRLASKGPASAAELISDETVDALAVAGTASKCAEAVQSRCSTGIRHFIVSPPYGPNPERALSTFSREIIHRLKR
jgi:5,10-methylenetetrahydromethanopterin reductase